MSVVLKTELSKLSFLKRGKVRDLYQVGDDLLLISTDRLSAFDVIMNQGIPYKGVVLTQISNFWFEFTKDIIKNHTITTDVNNYPPECKDYSKIIEGRSVLVKKTKVIPIECIVRGYITGSGLKDYQRTGEICGVKLPPGLVESEKLPTPIFTPSTKAEVGDHDENISIEKAKEIAGAEIVDKLEYYTLEIFKKCSEFALTKGIIIADTKMEFGMDENGEIILIDELLTPDSSRFWPLSNYKKGFVQESFDKQYVRDYLVSVKFNKMPPPPDLPEEIIGKTSLKYIEALKRLTGQELQIET
ncbi:MAG: phosphoribosylaminoimidazolesuccinocarboxamide synthase [Ignavibacteriales bacterium]|nr:phosphoribosylaminoimidazolesuccinocarboxamide synthase [Ignavibacteriales bacterium]HOJ17610.1 phosphoribosylaminoimidazolesuccinocarboxamide synthase [Ignavibacteriaceae bacterium]